MNDLMNSAVVNLGLLAAALLILIAVAVLWFFALRANSRANEQIELLDALLDQQKRQTALLRRLCEANEPEDVSVAKESDKKPANQDEDFIRLVAER